MKISEIVQKPRLREDTSDDINNLLSVLLYLKSRTLDTASESDDEKTISAKSIIQLVRNAGSKLFTYNSLVRAVNSVPAVSNIIKQIDDDTVWLQLSGDNEQIDNSSELDLNDNDVNSEELDVGQSEQPQPEEQPLGNREVQPAEPQQQMFAQSPVNTVNNMARSAASRRI